MVHTQQTHQRRRHQPGDVHGGGERQYAQRGKDLRRRQAQKVVEQI